MIQTTTAILNMDVPPLMSEFALAYPLEALIWDKSTIGAASARGDEPACLRRKQTVPARDGFGAHFGDRARRKPVLPGRFGAMWPVKALTSLSVRLADAVVPWHTFNLVGFGPVNFQACHSKYQSSRCQAETLSLYRCRVDLLGQALTFA
jgi:hypothetical protein